ncbi:hypothetical protein BC938DRAFT_473607 [Jimgerdemannia flammicorona]|uniref:Uncharacterized protein n=1 Tax=Jimgerdemannia flammicorona TaxID=994334 RepID=A0A433QT92_9FUNG|nr:hypothetical protein BC938DRAFT_473607 [Jimgerdemannia flammicorona]
MGVHYRLPLHIGVNVSVERVNAFLVLCEAPGYNFKINADGNVFIFDVAYAEHEVVVSLIQDCFKVANDGVVRNPLTCVCGQPWLTFDLYVVFKLFLYPSLSSSCGGIVIAPNIAVSPDIAHYTLSWTSPQQHRGTLNFCSVLTPFYFESDFQYQFL